ncbi:MAG: amino acid ABC transporter permease, partial [Pyramidobacter sp.]|nr:amino acid ABC transporter permease [Pyramidobacter sp.]
MKKLMSPKRAALLWALAAVLACAACACAAETAPARKFVLHFERIWPFYKVFYNGMLNSLKVTILSLIVG